MNLFSPPKCVGSSAVSKLQAMQEKLCSQKNTRLPINPLPKRRVAIKKPKVKPKPGEGVFAAMVAECRARALAAVSEINTEAPRFQAARMTGVSALRHDAAEFMKHSNNNLQMLIAMGATLRSHGSVNPFRYDQIIPNSSDLPFNIKLLERLEEKNQVIGQHIKEAATSIDTGRNKGKPELASKRQPFKMNRKVLDIYKDYNVHMPKTNDDSWRLFRPRVYFDVVLKGQPLLGRFVIQLYTEAAPLVVLQVVRACMCKSPLFLIKRIFPDLWLDVELPLEHKSPLCKRLEYNGKIIDHAKHGYVLSFSKDHLNGFRDKLAFDISLRPISVLNGQRVGFGRVIKGQRIVDCLRDYGSKNGKILRAIELSDCGFL